jgi:hemoglobin
MKFDLDSRENVEFMIRSFYEKVNVDEQISRFFKQVVFVDWEKHLPIMYDFWESVILGSPTYTGNPMQTHIQLNEKSPLKKEDFDRWLHLFELNLNENFSGKFTEIARQRAISIATVMQLKILH